MKLSLLVLTQGKQEGKSIEIKLPQFLIGRDPQCHLRPASPMISKRHCAIIQKEGKAFIRDFGSTNGTFVNEEPVKGERELHNDDALKIGPIMFTVRLEKTVEVAKTPAPATKPENRTPVPPTKTTAKPAPNKNDTQAPATAPAAKTAPAEAAKATPAAAKPAAATAKGKSEDDDIAAMLLSLEDDSSSGEGTGESPHIPDGSTVFDLKVPPEVAAGQKPGEGGKPAAPAAKPAATGNTQSAAARILEKMTKRPRT